MIKEYLYRTSEVSTADPASTYKAFKIKKREADGGISDNFFQYGATNIPHDMKRHKGGEDAWVASNNLIGISYGVSVWAY